MLLSRIYRIFAGIVIILLLTVNSSYAHEFDSELEIFLSEIPAISDVKDLLAENLIHVPENDSYSANLKHDGNLYSVVIMSVNSHSEADVNSELEIMTQDIAINRAETKLALYLGQDKIDKDLYINDEALGHALLMFYVGRIRDQNLRGIENISGILENSRDKFAVGVAWLKSDVAETLGLEIPERELIDEDYCQFLYERVARDSFNAGKYDEALELFVNLRVLRYENLNAYIDAAECFLRTGQPQDCVKLLREIHREYDEKITSANFYRMGKLSQSSGDKVEALKFFRAGTRRLHEEQRRRK